MASKVYWTRQARDDLRAIRDHIARDAPATAAAFVRRLRMSVGRLRKFPYAGQVVPEIGEYSIREILFGSYHVYLLRPLRSFVAIKQTIGFTQNKIK